MVLNHELENQRHVFNHFTPEGCKDNRVQLFAIPNDIDGCIIEQANKLKINLDKIPKGSSNQLVKAVKENCSKTNR